MKRSVLRLIRLNDTDGERVMTRSDKIDGVVVYVTARATVATHNRAISMSSSANAFIGTLPEIFPGRYISVKL